MDLTPSRRGFLYEAFRKDLELYLKKQYGRHAMGANQTAILREAVGFYFRHLEPDIKETKAFPKKGEPVEKSYVVKIELQIPGLQGRTMEFEKKFNKITLDNA